MTKEFASELSNAMIDRRMSQRGLGEASGVDHSTISRLLTGERDAGHEVAQGLMEGLRVAPEQRVRFLLLAAGHRSEFIQSVIGVAREVPASADPLTRSNVRQTG